MSHKAESTCRTSNQALLKTTTRVSQHAYMPNDLRWLCPCARSTRERHATCDSPPQGSRADFTMRCEDLRSCLSVQHHAADLGSSHPCPRHTPLPDHVSDVIDLMVSECVLPAYLPTLSTSSSPLASIFVVGLTIMLIIGKSKDRLSCLDWTRITKPSF